MTKPTHEQFDLAIEWLNSNEGEGGERAACLVVAQWIAEMQTNSVLRSEARKAGIPVAAIRRRLEENRKAKT